MRLCNSNTDSIRKSLSEWASGDFDAISVIRLRMAGSQRVELAEILKVIDGELVAKEDEYNILKSTTVGMVSWVLVTITGKGLPMAIQWRDRAQRDKKLVSKTVQIFRQTEEESWSTARQRSKVRVVTGGKSGRPEPNVIPFLSHQGP